MYVKKNDFKLHFDGKYDNLRNQQTFYVKHCKFLLTEFVKCCNFYVDEGAKSLSPIVT